MNDELDFSDDDTDPAAPGPETPAPAPAKKTPAKRPAKRAAKKPAPKAPADTAPKIGRPTNKDKLRQSIEQQLLAIGVGLAGLGVATGNAAIGADGASVMDHSEPIALALVEVAEQNPTVRKYLEKGIEGSAWIGVVIAVGGLAKSIAENHSAPTEESPAPAAGAFSGLRGAV